MSNVLPIQPTAPDVRDVAQEVIDSVAEMMADKLAKTATTPDDIRAEVMRTLEDIGVIESDTTTLWRYTCEHDGCDYSANGEAPDEIAAHDAAGAAERDHEKYHAQSTSEPAPTAATKRTIFSSFLP
jgi:hypothetical protein